MLIYEHRGAEIHLKRGRAQPYATWEGDVCRGFDAEYLGALKRIAWATHDDAMQASLNSDGVLKRVRERQHRPLRTVA